MISAQVIVKRNIIGRVASRIAPVTRGRKQRLIHRVWELDRAFAPVDTGFLQANIVETENGVEGRAPYDIHQEFGTSTQPGTPHHRPAAAQGMAELNTFFDGFEAEITR